MVEWKDQGFILGIRSFGEKDAILHVLTQHHGCHAGVLKNFKSKPNQALQMGSLVRCHWKARLSEHLGMWSLEPEKSYLASVLGDPQRLLALSMAAQFTTSLLPERHPYPHFYALWSNLLETLAHEAEWKKEYVFFEFHLLQELGFGLKLDVCAVSNTSDNLKYVSPKTGCAVREDIGMPYHDKLFQLPSFLGTKEGIYHPKDIRDGLEMTGYFLMKHFSEQKYANLFQTRQRFIENL